MTWTAYYIYKHNDSWGTYSATQMPWRLVYVETYPSRSDAILRERQIKTKKSRKYLQYLTDNELPIMDRVVEGVPKAFGRSVYTGNCIALNAFGKSRRLRSISLI